MSQKIHKTNALRILDAQKISYKALEYPIDDGLIDGVSVWTKVGVDPKVFFKTLVARGKDKRILVFVIPISKELDLKKAAQAAGEKSIELVAVKELLGLTGYVRGGCSPIGMKKKFPTFTDSSIELIESIYVSAGKKGMIVGMSTSEYVKITESVLVAVAH